jgi:hypothetical protein
MADKPLLESVKRGLAVALLMAFLFPMGIMIHECGHFLAGKALGWNVTFSATSVGYSYTVEPPLGSRLLFLAAGIVCDVAFVTAGLFWLSRQCRQSQRVGGPKFWIATTLTIFSVRWSLAPLFVAIGKSDEGFMSELLGMNRWTIPLITMAVGIPIAVYVIKQHCDQR